MAVTKNALETRPTRPDRKLLVNHCTHMRHQHHRLPVKIKNKGQQARCSLPFKVNSNKVKHSKRRPAAWSAFGPFCLVLSAYFFFFYTNLLVGVVWVCFFGSVASSLGPRQIHETTRSDHFVQADVLDNTVVNRFHLFGHTYCPERVARARPHSSRYPLAARALPL